MMKTVDSVLRQGMCSGCGACAQLPAVQIGMRLENGQIRPVNLGDPTTSQSALAVDVSSFCPGVRVRGTGGPSFHKWGPIVSASVGAAQQDDVRRLGSSGGALTALAMHLLETGEVEAVLHVGADESSPIKTSVKISTNSYEVLQGAGSRYAPVATLSRLHETLARFSRVAVIAKPCEISALRALQRTDRDAAEKVKYAFSFFCAGVPSQAGTERLVAQLGADPARVTELRYRGNGWPGYFSVKDSAGRGGKRSYADSWGSVLNQHLQSRCKMCLDGIGEEADVTAADYWETDDKGYPLFEDGDGQSLILARTEKGQKLLDEARESSVLTARVTDPALVELDKMQSYQADRRRFMLARVAGRTLRGKSSPKYSVVKMMRLARGPVSGHMRQLFGSWRRAR